ncbi:MAG: hypothetical protein ACI9CO_000094 [Candidatus Azotimanducaceae bacterium]|jgi:hypothetical protein
MAERGIETDHSTLIDGVNSCDVLACRYFNLSAPTSYFSLCNLSVTSKKIDLVFKLKLVIQNTS